MQSAKRAGKSRYAVKSRYLVYLNPDWLQPLVTKMVEPITELNATTFELAARFCIARHETPTKPPAMQAKLASI